MDYHFSYPVSDCENGWNVEKLLKSRKYSRRLISQLKQYPSGLTIEGKQVYTNYILSSGQILDVHIKETSCSDIIPVPMELSIVYEDSDLMVIDKPFHMPVHPSMDNYDNTLANGLACYFRQQNLPFVFRIINRLDRDTTGLLIVAKHSLSAGILSQMIAHRKISRTYLAVAKGKTPANGIIEAPIARLDDSIIERCVDFEQGTYAKTCYETLSYAHDCSLVSLKLETGRTHQIRVHMKYIGHPLLGDFIYNPDFRQIKRQALHSSQLAFIHPITEAPLHFYSPLPADMESILHQS